VLVDSTRPELDSITIDDEAAGHLAARHLVERGRRSIAYVSETQRSTVYVSQGQRRRSGVTRALTEAGLDPAGLRPYRTTSDIDGGRTALAAMLADGLPDAVFAHHDLVAAGVLTECRQRGIRVPDDLAIIGFDDSELSVALEITTVSQPLEESGRLGLRQLREAIGGAALAPRHVTLPVRIVIRATT
jgi:DNA-binding LacI/PurR family transcriptional regulator